MAVAGAQTTLGRSTATKLALDMTATARLQPRLPVPFSSAWPAFGPVMAAHGTRRRHGRGDTVNIAARIEAASQPGRCWYPPRRQNARRRLQKDGRIKSVTRSSASLGDFISLYEFFRPFAGHDRQWSKRSGLTVSNHRQLMCAILITETAFAVGRHIVPLTAARRRSRMQSALHTSLRVRLLVLSMSGAILPQQRSA
jgi:hypothetical protein